MQIKQFIFFLDFILVFVCTCSLSLRSDNIQAIQIIFVMEWKSEKLCF